MKDQQGGEGCCGDLCGPTGAGAEQWLNCTWRKWNATESRQKCDIIIIVQRHTVLVGYIRKNFYCRAREGKAGSCPLEIFLLEHSFISQSQQEKFHQNKRFHKKQGRADATVQGSKTAVYGIFCMGYVYSQSRQNSLSWERHQERCLLRRGCYPGKIGCSIWSVDSWGEKVPRP